PAADPGLTPSGGGFALIVAGDAGGRGANGSPSPALLNTMLGAALAENEPRRILIWAQDLGGRPGSPASALREAARRGCTVLTRPADPWQAIERADLVYAAGGEIGLLALLAG